jgi:hypothetical protein
MRKELREQILDYNKRATEKARDMEYIANELKKLPPGQLKKVLNDNLIAVFTKYGVDFKDNKE